MRDAVAGVTAAGSTSLYDAVDVALMVLATAGDQRIVVLSEGPDTASTLDLPGLLARAALARNQVLHVQDAAVACAMDAAQEIDEIYLTAAGLAAAMINNPTLAKKQRRNGVLMNSPTTA